MSGAAPRVGEPLTIQAGLRFVGFRALLAGALLATAFAGVLYLRAAPVPTPRELLEWAGSGFVFGLLAIALPSVVEGALRGWEEARVLRGFLLLYLAALVGWLLGFVQVRYVWNVYEGRAYGEAVVIALQGLLRGPPFLLVFHFALPAALALASLRHLRWLTPRGSKPWTWGVFALVVAGILGARADWAYAKLLGLPALTLALAVAVTLHYALTQVLHAKLWPDDVSPSEDFVGEVVVEPPSAPPTLAERVAMGGDPNMIVGSLAWLLVGIAIVRGTPTGVAVWVGLLLLLGWFVHLVAGSNLPAILLARGRPERALDLARYFLRHRTQGARASQGKLVRIHRETEVRALLALGRDEEALALLPEALAERVEGIADSSTRLRLGQDLVNGGHYERCLDVVAPIPRERSRLGLDLRAEVLESVALAGLERWEEALEKTEANLDHPSLAQPRVKAVLLNNRAVYQLDLGRDPELALAWAEEARNLAPDFPQLGTLGAAYLAAGDATKALGLLEEAPPSPTRAGRAWIAERIARCHRALGDEAEASAAFQRALEEDPASPAGRRAQRALGGEGPPKVAATNEHSRDEGRA